MHRIFVVAVVVAASTGASTATTLLSESEEGELGASSPTPVAGHGAPAPVAEPAHG